MTWLYVFNNSESVLSMILDSVSYKLRLSTLTVVYKGLEVSSGV